MKDSVHSRECNNPHNGRGAARRQLRRRSSRLISLVLFCGHSSRPASTSSSSTSPRQSSCATSLATRRESDTRHRVAAPRHFWFGRFVVALARRHCTGEAANFRNRSIPSGDAPRHVLRIAALENLAHKPVNEIGKTTVDVDGETEATSALESDEPVESGAQCPRCVNGFISRKATGT